MQTGSVVRHLGFKVGGQSQLLKQAEVASDRELQAFRYAVLHLEDGGGATVRDRRSLACNRVIVVPMFSVRVEMATSTGSSSTTTPHSTSESEECHLPKGACGRRSHIMHSNLRESGAQI